MPLPLPSPRGRTRTTGPRRAALTTGNATPPLKQITALNADRLQAKWVYHVEGASGMEQTPVVMNGVMYISQFNRVDAIDARTGNIIRKYQPPPSSASPERGTAVYNNKVYMVTSDSHLVALDARKWRGLLGCESGGRLCHFRGHTYHRPRKGDCLGQSARRVHSSVRCKNP